MLLDFLMGSFNLTVGLRLICCNKCINNAKFLIKHFYQLHCELGAAIQDNLCRDTIKAECFLIVYVSDACIVYVKGSG